MFKIRDYFLLLAIIFSHSVYLNLGLANSNNSGSDLGWQSAAASELGATLEDQTESVKTSTSLDEKPTADLIMDNDNGAIENLGSKAKLAYSEYQLEILLFKPNQKNLSSHKELFTQEFKSINKSGALNFLENSVKPKFLLKDYDKLKFNNDYQIILYAATKYKLLPSQKTKKFIISSNAEVGTGHANLKPGIDFEILLTVIQVKPNFNIIFNGKVEQFNLYRSAKLKAKESYYFDHPMFGVLVNITGL